MRLRVWTAARRHRQDPESGQAMVEFALIAPLFLMIVVGVIQFGVALNFWFDMQRLVNQGARSAAVNCGPSAANQCGPTTLAAYLGPKRAATPEGQVISKGNFPTVEICYVPPTSNGTAPPGWTPSAGDAVRVTLTDRYRLQAIVNLAKIDLKARATMRLEQDPTSPALPDRTNSAYWVLATHTGTSSCKV